MFGRPNRIVLAAAATAAMIAAMAGPASARSAAGMPGSRAPYPLGLAMPGQPHAAPAPGAAPATALAPVNVTGDITWTADWTYPNTTGGDNQTGTFHIDMTNVNGSSPASSTTYSITDNLNTTSGDSSCTTTTTASYSGGGSLPLSSAGSPFFDFQLGTGGAQINIQIEYNETETETMTGSDPGCNGTNTFTAGNWAIPTCGYVSGSPLGIGGTFQGTYPNGTVNIGCSGSQPGNVVSLTYNITGTLTVTPATCVGAAGAPRPQSDGRPMTSRPGRLAPGQNLTAVRKLPAAGHRASARGTGSANIGGLTVAITSAVAEPPPKPANQQPLGAYFSIPRPGAENYWQRYYDLSYTVTEGSADATGTANLTNATVELDDSNGSTLQQNIVNEGPGADGKVSIIGCGIARVQVTYSGGTTSTVDSTPPPANQIEYKFTLSAQDPATGAAGTSADFTSQPVYALWKIPDGLPRFSPCDQAGHNKKGPGGDDWVSQSTYNWMTANQQLLTAINNTSFEHGINLGPHNTHGTGNDIDMFHVYGGLTGASQCSGTEYYNTLVQTVQNALTGNAAAKQQVTNWVEQTRARFDQLLPISHVRLIIYAHGAAVAATSAQPGLPDGWAQDLLTAGTFTNAAGKTLTVAGAWAGAASPKMRYRTDHDNHIHLALASG